MDDDCFARTVAEHPGMMGLAGGGVPEERSARTVRSNGGQHFVDVVTGTLRKASIPLASGPAVSGLAVSPNGRVVRVALYATDGGLKRPIGLWTAWLNLAAELLREVGFPVIVSKPGLEITLGTPLAAERTVA